MARRVRYGVDGWPYLASLSASSAVLVGATMALRRRPALASLAALGALASAVPASMGAWYVWRGKLRLRDLLLDMVTWHGDEIVVDLGAGAGLLAIGAARRTKGPVHAIDLFVSKDLSGNAAARLSGNAAIEGVSDRIIVHHKDIRETGLADASVDVALSTLCLHNLGETEARAAALDEMIRVLRPGGQIAISDFAHLGEYTVHLESAGFTVVRTGKVPGAFPPQRFLVATTPAL